MKLNSSHIISRWRFIRSHAAIRSPMDWLILLAVAEAGSITRNEIKAACGFSYDHIGKAVRRFISMGFIDQTLRRTGHCRPLKVAHITTRALAALNLAPTPATA